MYERHCLVVECSASTGDLESHEAKSSLKGEARSQGPSTTTIMAESKVIQEDISQRWETMSSIIWALSDRKKES